MWCFVKTIQLKTHFKTHGRKTRLEVERIQRYYKLHGRKRGSTQNNTTQNTCMYTLNDDLSSYKFRTNPAPESEATQNGSMVLAPARACPFLVFTAI